MNLEYKAGRPRLPNARRGHAITVAVASLLLPLFVSAMEARGGTGIAWAAVPSLPARAVAQQTGLFQLPISFPVQSPEVAAYFIEMARPEDIASVPPSQLFLLPEDTPGQKMVAFRSLADAQQELDGLGPVDMVMYNPEHWEFTPENEQQDLAATVRQFADLVHARDLPFMFAPDRRYAEEYLQQVAPDIDAVLLQGQQLQHDPQAFATWVLGMAEIGHTANPELEVFVQVGATRGTASEMYTAIQGVVDGIDGIAVWSLPRTLDVLEEFVTLVRESPPAAERTPTSPGAQATSTTAPLPPEVPTAPPTASPVPMASDTPTVAPSASPSPTVVATEVMPSPVAPAPGAQSQASAATAFQGVVTNVLLFVGGIGIGVMLGFFLGWRLRP